MKGLDLVENIYKVSSSYDPDKVEWRNYKDPNNKEFKIDFDYSLLGFDVQNGRLDMLLRYPGGKSHCRRHRHIASTLTLVLEGDQYLMEVKRDGARNYIHRKKGDYDLDKAVALPHLEHGGEKGGTVFLSMQTKNGILFEYFDENMKHSWTVSIEEFVKSWNEGATYGENKTEFTNE